MNKRQIRTEIKIKKREMRNQQRKEKGMRFIRCTGTRINRRDGGTECAHDVPILVKDIDEYNSY